MRIRFQADADLNQIIVSAVLRRLPEADFRSARDAGLAGLHDLDVLAIAARCSSRVTDDEAQVLRTVHHEHGEPGGDHRRQRLAVGQVVEDLILIWTVTAFADERPRSRRGSRPRPVWRAA